MGLVIGCYDGPGPAEPPPGSPGGLCYPTASCDLGFPCDPVGLFCYDPADPCRGVFCGDHGLCAVDADSNLPVCMCDQGYSNFRYSLYCEPV